MGRSPCCSKEGLNRGAWTALEDKILTAYIKAHGEGKWRNLPKRAGLKRCGKSCRLRWLNYLRPDIKRGNISHDEEELIIRLHNLLGNRWSLIAGRLPGRTDNEIKNYWNTTLGKKAGKSRARTQAITNPKTANSPAATTQAQVIRTKAFKCTSKVHFPTCPPLNYNNPAYSTDLISVEPQAHQTHMKIPCDSDNLMVGFGGEETNTTSDFDNLGCDEAQASDDDAKEKNSYNCNFSMVSAHPLTFDQSVFEDWTSVNCLEDNATLDLGSFSFLLDSEEWP